MPEIRLRRIESLLREEICALIQTGQVKDPRVEPLTTVTEVKVSRDLGHAKVWVSRFGDRDAVSQTVDALNHAAGYIQGVLARRISLRVFPRLSFHRDDAMENGFRIARKLREIAAASAAPGEAGASEAPGPSPAAGDDRAAAPPLENR
jgi:ribosome-binding factor A